jgi:hypothetical protein
MLSGTGYPSGENYPAGTGMELFFYPHAGTNNPTGKILRVRVRVRVSTVCRVRTRCHLDVCVLFPAGHVPRSRTLGPVPRCCRPAPDAPPVAEPLPFFPLRTSSRPSHGHDVRTGTRQPKVPDDDIYGIAIEL